MALTSYEEVLTEISTPHEYFQIILFLLLSWSALQVSYEYNMMLFNTFTPAYNCTTQQSVSSDQCSIYQNSSSVEQCNSWSYDRSIMKNSFAMEANLVCHRSYFKELGDSVFYSAAAIGQLLGFLPDLYGRRRMLLFYCAWDIIACQLLPITANIYVNLTLRFVRGLSAGSLAYLGLCLLTEILPLNRRSVYGANYWNFWSIGYASIGGIAYFTQDWRLIRYFTCIPQVVYIFYFFFVPESPRWLFLKGRRNEAIETFIRIGKFNGKTLTEEDFDKFDSAPFDTFEDFKNSLKCPKLLKRFLVACVMQISFSVSYSGLSLLANYASPNIYLSSLFSGLCELPSGLVAWFLCVCMGRKASLAFLFLLTTFCIVPTPWFQTRDMITVASVIAVIGKFSLTTGYNIESVYLNELFPTTTRYSSSLYSASLGSFIVIAVPQINHLSQINPIIPNAIYGCLTFTASVLIISCLPETKDWPLTQMVSETSGGVASQSESSSKTKKSLTDNESSKLIK